MRPTKSQISLLSEFSLPNKNNFVFLAIQNDDSDHTTQGTFSDVAAQISVMDEVKT